MKHFILLLFLSLITISCKKNEEKRQVQLYTTYCASCHIAPKIDALPRHLWSEKVLPEMAARMGIQDSTNDPLKGLSMREQAAVLSSGVYP
ncbi:MAG: VCBS repeat-containing protein, partial [Pricia sp.]|nr:VCBS repeat-containing protein [Pricia sp.]